jgi:broad specificity phosphatase PhoE
VCLAGLRERHLGELEGKTVPEAKLQCPLAWQVLQAGSFSERIPVRHTPPSQFRTSGVQEKTKLAPRIM